MERKLVRVQETQADLLLSGFRLVFAESLRNDLEPTHQQYVKEALNEIATNCVNMGLGHNLTKIREDEIMKQKLLDLKTAYDQIKPEND